MTTVELANGKTITLREVTDADFEKVRCFISDYFEKGNFPFDFYHGNISKTDFGKSFYTTVDAFEEFFMESITIRVSDHSVGQRRASSEICFNYSATKDEVFLILDLKFKQYKK